MLKREKITFKIKKGKGKLKWRSKSKDKSNKKWYNNGKLRHFKRDCFEWKKKQKKSNNGKLRNVVVGSELESMYVMIV